MTTAAAAITDTVVARRRTAWTVLIAVATVVIWMRWAPVDLVRIASGSMSPGLAPGDHALILHEPLARIGRGSLVVFEDPGGWRAAAERAGDRPTSGLFVKRVIGVGSDTVQCCDVRGRLQVNGQPLSEDYLGEFHELLSFKVTVPRGSLWVMGDNRDESFDSRYAGATPGGGFVRTEDVRGKVLWPRLDARLGTIRVERIPG